jgi:hypothetical protein
VLQVPATALQLAAKDRQLAEVQEENSLLRQQIAEMERALQMASEYHAATQAAHKVSACAGWVRLLLNGWVGGWGVGRRWCGV